MSKEIRPKHRLGQRSSWKKTAALWTIALAVVGGAGFAAYRTVGTTEVEVPVARVRKGDFVVAVRARGDIKSARSVTLTAPQVPEPRIVRLAENGRPVKKGDVVIEFDAEQQRQYYLERDTNVRTVDSEIVQLVAAHKITNEMDSMSLMQAEYNVERAKLEASKAEILSAIEGAKNRINVDVSHGELQQVQTSIESRKVAQQADVSRLDNRKDKTIRDRDLAQSYISKMVVRAPIDGIVNLLPNARSGGSWGQSPPAFKEGDRAWTGAAIAEIPDLSEMRIELKLEEVDRGRLKLDQQVRIRVDAIPDREFNAKLDWISPIAALVYKGFGNSDKVFPARATLMQLDDRLRPGMSATAEVIIDRQPGVLIIPARASFLHDGKPAVYVQRGQQFSIREIEVGDRSEEDLVVLSGLTEGEIVTLENPEEAARRARKKL
ncbi:MAG: efflux RND transporter periplasmic adaptor subunit [Bryobacterales bacterium]|nr:efflux RND transporter periplasmic adaptor subunit [Bryobacterales bacterium]